MINIILIGHGASREGLLASLQIIAGGDYGVRAVPLISDESPEAYCEKLETAMREADDGSGSGTIALSDTAGDIPFQSAAYLSKDFRLGFVSGMNMPMPLTFALEHSEETTLEELANKTGISGIVGVKAMVLKKGKRKRRAKLSINRNR